MRGTGGGRLQGPGGRGPGLPEPVSAVTGRVQDPGRAHPAAPEAVDRKPGCATAAAAGTRHAEGITCRGVGGAGQGRAVWSDEHRRALCGGTSPVHATGQVTAGGQRPGIKARQAGAPPPPRLGSGTGHRSFKRQGHVCPLGRLPPGGAPGQREPGGRAVCGGRDAHAPARTRTRTHTGRGRAARSGHGVWKAALPDGGHRPPGAQ